jgi:uncharacterized protein (TIGR01777 family)
MSPLRVTVTGATGLIGTALVAALRDRGAQVTILSRDPERAQARLGCSGQPALEAIRWEPISEPAPAEALTGRDAVVHLTGENLAQRWTATAKRAIRESRVSGTRNLIEGLARAEERPRTLVSGSAIGYYGPHGEEPLDEDALPGTGFLAGVCVAWEREAEHASELGMRVVQLRTGVVLDRGGGALASMLTPFRLGVGGPVAGGRQYISWIHTEDLVGLALAAVEDERFHGPINATAPEPVSNRDFSHALGKVLRRPSFLPMPGLAMRMLFGEMSLVITTGARVLPAKPLVLGYRFRHPRLDEALRAALEQG